MELKGSQFLAAPSHKIFDFAFVLFFTEGKKQRQSKNPKGKKLPTEGHKIFDFAFVLQRKNPKGSKSEILYPQRGSEAGS